MTLKQTNKQTTNQPNKQTPQQINLNKHPHPHPHTPPHTPTHLKYTNENKHKANKLYPFEETKKEKKIPDPNFHASSMTRIQPFAGMIPSEEA